MQLLASDVNNPEFMGATNPDSLLSVEFFMDNPEDKWASDHASYEQGRKVTILKHKHKVPYIRISRPGDNTSVVVQEVREDHKRRFPQQWLYFALGEGLIEDQITGWKIEEWPFLNESQVRDLKYMRFHTVEQIAGASDAAVQSMGMMGPGLRAEAKKALRDTLENKIKEEASSKDKQIADLQEQMAAMKEMIEKLSAKPRGRPPKVENG